MHSPRPHLRDMLIKDEGVRLTVYKCPTGYLTIGVGRNLEATGITMEEANMLLDHDIIRIEAEASSLDWFADLNSPRQDVILSMIFQLGLSGVKKFLRMIVAIKAEDWQEAATQMMDSNWHRQTPERCERLAAIMERGES